MKNQRHPQVERRAGRSEGGLSSNDLARVIEALTGERLSPGASDSSFDSTAH
ncbi:hypothetical protein DEU38_12023 [Rhodococcus sp. AG1013]|nr:hypothetical protein DEU38_12023 [Rhodococcus sp. AG1013]